METRVSEVEAKLNGMGDYVKIDYLDRILRSQPNIEVRKFVHIELAKLYEDKRMFNEAGRNCCSAGDETLRLIEKMNYYMKAVGLYIRGGYYIESDAVFKRALASANKTEKRELKSSLKNIYSEQASQYEKEKKNNKAIVIYEKLMHMDINEEDKQEIKQKLLKLYDRLGKLREFRALGGFEE